VIRKVSLFFLSICFSILLPFGIVSLNYDLEREKLIEEEFLKRGAATSLSEASERVNNITSTLNAEFNTIYTAASSILSLSPLIVLVGFMRYKSALDRWDFVLLLIPMMVPILYGSIVFLIGAIFTYLLFFGMRTSIP